MLSGQDAAGKILRDVKSVKNCFMYPKPEAIHHMANTETTEK